MAEQFFLVPRRTRGPNKPKVLLGASVPVAPTSPSAYQFPTEDGLLSTLPPVIPRNFRSHASVNSLENWRSQVIKLNDELAANRFNRCALEDALLRLRVLEVDMVARRKYAHEAFTDLYDQIAAECRPAAGFAPDRSKSKRKRGGRVIIDSSEETDELEEEDGSPCSGGEMDLS